MKTRAILVIIFTLVIGFVLGMLSSSLIREARLKEMRSHIIGREFNDMMMEIIQPDEKQKDELEKIMKKFDKSTHEMQSRFRDDFDSVSKEYRKEIDTLLTAEQRERLRKMDEHNREMMESMRGHDNQPRGFGRRHMPPRHEGRPGFNDQPRD